MLACQRQRNPVSKEKHKVAAKQIKANFCTNDSTRICSDPLQKAQCHQAAKLINVEDFNDCNLFSNVSIMATAFVQKVTLNRSPQMGHSFVKDLE